MGESDKPTRAVPLDVTFTAALQQGESPGGWTYAVRPALMRGARDSLGRAPQPIATQ
jgi:hypothetical protein